MSERHVQRFLLRSVISSGKLSYHDANEILSETFGDHGYSIQDLIKKINNEIQPFQQNIKLVKDQKTMQNTLVFLSLGNDDATKSQKVFTEVELNYFMNILKQILETETRQITEINAFNLRETIHQSDAEGLLITWCRMGYLENIGNNYELGIRAIYEFERYIKENFPDIISNCYLCKLFVFTGYNCPNCEEAIHRNCLKDYTDKHRKWPCCKAAFNQAYLDRLNAHSVSETLRSTLQPAMECDVIFDLSEDDNNEDNEITLEISRQKRKR